MEEKDETKAPRSLFINDDFLENTLL